MAVKLRTKSATKATPKAAQAEEVVTKESLVDSIGAVQKKMAPLLKKLDPLTKEFKSLEGSLLTLVDDEFKPEQTLDITAEEYLAEVGAKGNSTEVDSSLACDALENVREGLALELAQFKIADLKAYLTPEEFAKVTTTERTAKRKIKIKDL